MPDIRAGIERIAQLPEIPAFDDRDLALAGISLGNYLQQFRSGYRVIQLVYTRLDLPGPALQTRKNDEQSGISRQTSLFELPSYRSQTAALIQRKLEGQFWQCQWTVGIISHAAGCQHHEQQKYLQFTHDQIVPAMRVSSEHG